LLFAAPAPPSHIFVPSRSQAVGRASNSSQPPSDPIPPPPPPTWSSSSDLSSPALAPLHPSLKKLLGVTPGALLVGMQVVVVGLQVVVYNSVGVGARPTFRRVASGPGRALVVGPLVTVITRGHIRGVSSGHCPNLPRWPAPHLVAAGSGPFATGSSPRVPRGQPGLEAVAPPGFWAALPQA
jgi:hypothetical protein